MGLFSFFQGGAKYFDKKIEPKCDYCMYGKRTKDGNRVLCEKRGLVEQNYSCKAFIYSPLKRIPVKQLRFVGSIADDDLFIESKGDIAEKEEAEKKIEEKSGKKANNKPPAEKAPSAEEKKQPAEQPSEPPQNDPAPVQNAPAQEAPAGQTAPVQPAAAPAEENQKKEPEQNVQAAEKSVQQNEAARV